MMDVSQLIKAAKEATGLTQFGEDGWQVGLEILVHSANREAGLNAIGAGTIEAMLVGLLAQRLQVEDWYARHPEIDEQAITAPLMVLGLPRTGSTALHNLLAADPSVRVLRNWESTAPCPPPETATQHTDPRIAAMAEQMVMRDLAMPRMKQMLPMTATSPIEDQFLMALDFKSQVFMPMFRIPSYVEWFDHEADLVPTFRYVKRVLKLLQWRCPPSRWRLKNPTYSQCIEALDTVFPDARYCMTHRDVEDVIPSVADLYFEMAQRNTERPDKAWIGEATASNCELGMRRTIAFRDSGNEDRFLDLHFKPLQSDPIPRIERLYAFLGEPFSEETRRNMLAWRQATPRDKHGRHKYSADDFGLDKQALRARFTFYYDRFGASG
ncbi:sulfotransferase family protein [Novosphingobium malaysiense]|uniref:sulfotransferase family protein n=1 Tax=Novosphingobium malaysiense TaxID=1348853 RepID=UPI00068F4B9E|nr:sulfotransferase [Novosphingobium malaysiense]